MDDYSRYAWVFFLANKGKTFGFARDLILRLKNVRRGDVVRAIRSDNSKKFKNSLFETFCYDLDLDHQFLLPMWLVRMVWLKGKIGIFVIWLGLCSMSIGLRRDIGQRR
jgi:hypothetical protein